MSTWTRTVSTDTVFARLVYTHLSAVKMLSNEQEMRRCVCLWLQESNHPYRFVPLEWLNEFDSDEWHTQATAMTTISGVSPISLKTVDWHLVFRRLVNFPRFTCANQRANWISPSVRSPNFQTEVDAIVWWGRNQIRKICTHKLHFRCRSLTLVPHRHINPINKLMKILIFWPQALQSRRCTINQSTVIIITITINIMMASVIIMAGGSGSPR